MIEEAAPHVEQAGATRAAQIFAPGRREHIAANLLYVDGHLTDWQASSRYGMPAARATRPMATAGLTSPPLVGTWVKAINFTRSSIIERSASTESWPDASSGTTSMLTPVLRATCR